jgi:hypothetical protein
MDRLTTIIKREWLAKIITGTKRIEYREIKPYWTERLKGATVPFELRLINGMNKKAPEAILLIEKIDIGKQESFNGYFEGDVYRLHIRKILSVKNWPVK